MSVVPGEIEPAQQPPMTLPLRHFIVAGGFLLLGLVASVGVAVDLHPALALVHVHLLLAGWVCVTIMGAMTQFVPVWSGVELHSARLAAAQLPLVGVGLLGFAACLLTGRLTVLPLAGAILLAGFWAFVYSIGRTLATVDQYDVSERHFAVALGFFVAVTLLGLLLAIDFTQPVVAALPVTRSNLVASHATLAVFGAVLSTVLGALYQLSTMFTQTALHGVDIPLRRVEEAAHPVGVLLLATGRLLDIAPVASAGGLLVLLAVAAATVVLARRLWETDVEWTPMLSRYAVATVALALWVVLTLPAWLRAPLDPAVLFGAPGTAYLFLLGGVGFVVFGTLYHVVPFIVWVHRYSDRLGYEPVPMVDDLYRSRLALADFACLVAGTGLLVVADVAAISTATALAGGLLVLFGSILFTANLLSVVRTHSPGSLGDILGGSWWGTGADSTSPGNSRDG